MKISINNKLKTHLFKIFFFFFVVHHKFQMLKRDILAELDRKSTGEKIVNWLYKILITDYLIVRRNPRETNIESAPNERLSMS